MISNSYRPSCVKKKTPIHLRLRLILFTVLSPVWVEQFNTQLCSFRNRIVFKPISNTQHQLLADIFALVKKGEMKASERLIYEFVEASVKSEYYSSLDYVSKDFFRYCFIHTAIENFLCPTSAGKILRVVTAVT